MRYLVVVLPQALEDVEIIVSWLHQRSSTGATAWYRRWSAMLDELSRSADRCVEAPESADHLQQLLQLQFKTRRGHHYRINSCDSELEGRHSARSWFPAGSAVAGRNSTSR